MCVRVLARMCRCLCKQGDPLKKYILFYFISLYFILSDENQVKLILKSKILVFHEFFCFVLFYSILFIYLFIHEGVFEPVSDIISFKNLVWNVQSKDQCEFVTSFSKQNLEQFPCKIVNFIYLFSFGWLVGWTTVSQSLLGYLMPKSSIPPNKSMVSSN